MESLSARLASIGLLFLYLSLAAAHPRRVLNSRLPLETSALAWRAAGVLPKYIDASTASILTSGEGIATYVDPPVQWTTNDGGKTWKKLAKRGEISQAWQTTASSALGFGLEQRSHTEHFQVDQTERRLERVVLPGTQRVPAALVGWRRVEVHAPRRRCFLPPGRHDSKIHNHQHDCRQWKCPSHPAVSSCWLPCLRGLEVLPRQRQLEEAGWPAHAELLPLVQLFLRPHAPCAPGRSRCARGRRQGTHGICTSGQLQAASHKLL